jgi:hypothetical protein
VIILAVVVAIYFHINQQKMVLSIDSSEKKTRKQRDKEKNRKRHKQL